MIIGEVADADAFTRAAESYDTLTPEHDFENVWYNR